MANETVINLGAVLLIVMPVINLFFVRDGYRKYRADPGRSRILLALWVVKLTMWIFGVAFAIYAIRYLSDLPPFPFNGLSLIAVVLIIEFLPAFIYIVLSTYKNGD